MITGEEQDSHSFPQLRSVYMKRYVDASIGQHLGEEDDLLVLGENPSARQGSVCLATAHDEMTLQTQTSEGN